MKLNAADRSAAEVFLVFLYLGLTSFGGPIAHIGYFRRELVEKRQWLNDSEFAQLLAVCQFLPGPASSQLGFSLGLLRAGWLGAMAAFVAFTLPSALILFGFAALLPFFSGDISQSLLQGLKIVALVVVADAIVKMRKSLCPDFSTSAIAIFSAAVVIALGGNWAQLLVIGFGAVAGSLLCKTPLPENSLTVHFDYEKKLAAALLVLFFALLFGLPILRSDEFSLVSLADIFYRTGALVFGGGHVVLPLLEEAVVAPGMISEEEFLAGYGAAQVIPGPLFTFSVYLGAISSGTPHSSIGAITALVFIFAPGFLLLAGILPFWQGLRQVAQVRHALAGINAAVLGLLAASLYDPIFSAGIQNVSHAAIAFAGFLLLSVWRTSVLIVVAWCVSTSIIVHFILLA